MTVAEVETRGMYEEKLIFAIGVLALGFTATAPAHADFAIVKFNSGYCRVYDNTASAPGRNVRLVCVGLPPLLPPADLADCAAQAGTRRQAPALVLALLITSSPVDSRSRPAATCQPHAVP